MSEMINTAATERLIAFAERIELWRWSAARLPHRRLFGETPVPVKPPVHR